MSFSNGSSVISWPEELDRIHVLGFEIQGHPPKIPQLNDHQKPWPGTVFQRHLHIPTRGAEIRQIWPAGKPAKGDPPWGWMLIPHKFWWYNKEPDNDLQVSFTTVVKMISKVTNPKWRDQGCCRSFFWLCNEERLRVYQSPLPLDGRQDWLPLCRYLTSEWSMRIMN